MSERTKAENKAAMAEDLISQHKARVASELTATTGLETAEEWWTRHATLLAEKMRHGGVRKFRVELTPRGTYEFEVDPIESPNSGVTEGGHP